MLRKSITNMEMMEQALNMTKPSLLPSPNAHFLGYHSLTHSLALTMVSHGLRTFLEGFLFLIVTTATDKLAMRDQA